MGRMIESGHVPSGTTCAVGVLRETIGNLVDGGKEELVVVREQGSDVAFSVVSLGDQQAAGPTSSCCRCACRASSMPAPASPQEGLQPAGRYAQANPRCWKQTREAWLSTRGVDRYPTSCRGLGCLQVASCRERKKTSRAKD